MRRDASGSVRVSLNAWPSTTSPGVGSGHAAVDGALGGGDGMPRQPGDARRQRPHGVLDVVVAHHPVDVADGGRLLPRHVGAPEDDLEGPGPADEAGQALRAAGTGDDAERYLGLREFAPSGVAKRRSQASVISDPPPRRFPGRARSRASARPGAVRGAG